MKHLLAELAASRSLDEGQAIEAFELIMTGEARPSHVGALLAFIQSRGPTVEELVGAAKVMRSKVTRVDAPPGITLIDTCGTGGDGSATFNISTAAAIVAAAAGRPQGIAVAKHGNKAVTSKSGSSQVLEALGVNVQVDPPTLTRCLDEAGICFCFAPAHHPAMKHAGPIRAELGFRTIFNLLGPLTNPAGAKRQVIGVFSPGLTEVLAEVLRRLGSTDAMIVHGQLPRSYTTTVASAEQGHPAKDTIGLDELSTVGTNQISHLHDGKIDTYELDPASLGLPESPLASLTADGPTSSAAVISNILAGDNGVQRDIVCLNAAAALVVAGVSADLADGLEMARQALDTGAAASTLAALVRITNEGSSV